MKSRILIIIALMIGMSFAQKPNARTPEGTDYISIQDSYGEAWDQTLTQVFDAEFDIESDSITANYIQLNGDFDSDIVSTVDEYVQPMRVDWTAGADMTAGGSYGIWGLARVNYSTQNVLGMKGQLYFGGLAAAETINIGAAIEASLDLDDTYGLTVASHLSGVSVSVTGTASVTGSGDYNKFNGAYVYWYTITDFDIETNGYLVETMPASDLDYGFNVYNSGTMNAGLWIHNNTGQSGTMVSDIKLSSGARIFTGSAANGNAVYAEVGTVDATGSMYITTAGALYVQVANAGSEADWYKCTTTNAD